MALDLRDHRAVVVGSSGPLPGSAITALTARSAEVAAVSSRALQDRDAVETAFLEIGYDDLDLIVFAHHEPAALRTERLVELDEASWEARCEEQLRAALFTVQAAYSRLRRRRGRLVMICPLASIEGVAGLVPLASAVEGQRILAKTAARRWGQDGITVNIVAPALTALYGPDDPDRGSADADRDGPALGIEAQAPDEVARLVALLAADEAEALTGATLGADGGGLMWP